MPALRKGRGNSRNEVMVLQQQLQAAGLYDGAIDGRFGQQTDLAVRNFQRQNGLTIDGKVGRNTAEMLQTRHPITPPPITPPAAKRYNEPAGPAVPMNGPTPPLPADPALDASAANVPVSTAKDPNQISSLLGATRSFGEPMANDVVNLAPVDIGGDKNPPEDFKPDQGEQAAAPVMTSGRPVQKNADTAPGTREVPGAATKTSLGSLLPPVGANPMTAVPTGDLATSQIIQGLQQGTVPDDILVKFARNRGYAGKAADAYAQAMKDLAAHGLQDAQVVK